MKALDIHGKIASEAEVLVRSFIKQSYNTRSQQVCIIHGNGKFILQKTVHKILSESKYVERFEYAPPQFGGTGATIIYLEKKGYKWKKS